jgi:uncharacterized membrane protein
MNEALHRDGDGARAAVVNRTHRVVREMALGMREQRRRQRSLWLPVGIFSVLMVMICTAAWYLLDGYDLTPTGLPDASDQMMLLMMWLLPVTLLVLVLAWFRRSMANHHDETTR